MDVLSDFSLARPTSPFQAPSPFYHAVTSPVQFWLSRIHNFLVSLRGSAIVPPHDAIRVVCISDTHTYTPKLPPGDVLIHAGDMTNAGSAKDIQAQIDWLASLPYQYVVVVAGNHDSYFDPRSRIPSDRDAQLALKDVRYLQHSKTILNFPHKGGRHLSIYGAPQIPECGGDEMAFQYRREDDAWTDTIPRDVDILVTHTPPMWHLDLPIGLGCQFLLKEVWKARPKVHLFGHVHAGRGMETVYWNEGQQAYERICAQPGWLSMLSFHLWFDILRVLVHDVLGIVWTWIWGAEPDATVMINCSHVDFKGKPAFRAEYIDI